ncbi:hypothetical protein M9980_07985 [Sphingomonas donggukensis]|uniref:Uncharacterized protein n=1 Tax=Sphingomonas donggukensis TaxID=2949093 RepID=A0ABY4TS13_9SPHN|nr:hypothetical protein [Sphingomonas donggukensis]URW74521.1 hypothetical protein M9980_07985 [Sphingomonas donggukensis]
MLPIPNSKVFRSRKGAIWWSFWVIVAAVMTVGFGDAPEKGAAPTKAVATDALGQPIDDKNLKDLMKVMEAS